MSCKTMTMNDFKVFLATAVLLAAAASCMTKEESTGKSHLEAFPDRYREVRRNGGGGAPAHAKLDTAVFMTAVSFPDDYDWRRDTSLGNVRGSIELYRNGEKMVSVPAGPGSRVSLDPDLHHLVEGHLYTESCTDNETFIGKDGEVLFSYPGRELLCGLLVENGDVYTLGQNRSGAGFSLRCNGKEILSRKDGFIAVHMSDNPDYPTGALYRDSGHLYFSYWEPGLSGNGRFWDIMEDGEGTPVDNLGNEGVYDTLGNASVRRWTYSDGTWKASLNIYGDGQVIVIAPSGSSAYYLSPALFFSFRNACLCGRDFYIGINPAEPGGKPFLWKDGETVFRPDINGYITALEVLVERDLVLPGDGS